MPEYNSFTCVCGVETGLEAMLVAHQAQCDRLDADKQAYRRALLPMFVGAENVDEVLELARKHALRFK